MAIPHYRPFTTVNPHVVGVGYCIYCGKSNITDLQREHVFPHGIGGGLILLNASCKRHCKITGAFEGVFLGKDIGPFRQATGLPSRRPKRETFPVDIKRGTNVETVQVPAEHHPSLLSLPVFATFPGAVSNGANGPVSVKSFRVFYNQDQAKLSIKNARYDAFRVSFNLHAFVRLLAKIAHGIMVAEFGSDFEPTLIELIEGHAVDQAGYLVGTCPLPIESGKKSTHGYRFATSVVGDGDLILVVVELRLFASAAKTVTATPTYSIVAGILEKGIHARWSDPLRTGATASMSAKK